MISGCRTDRRCLQLVFDERERPQGRMASQAVVEDLQSCLGSKRDLFREYRIFIDGQSVAKIKRDQSREIHVVRIEGSGRHRWVDSQELTGFGFIYAYDAERVQ